MTDQEPTRFHFYARVAGNTAYLFAALAVTALAMFGLDVLLARFLDRSDYGLVTYVVGLVMIPLILTDLGLSRSVPSLLAGALAEGDPDRANRVAAAGLFLQVVAAVVMAALVYLASFHLQSIVLAVRGWLGVAAEAGPPIPEYVAQWIRALIVALVCLAVARYLTSVFDGYQRMRFSFVAALFREPVRVAVVAAAFAFTVGPEIAVLALSFSTVLVLLLHVVLLRMFARGTAGCRLGITAAGAPALLGQSLYFYLPLVGLWLFPEIVKVVIGTLDSTDTLGRVKVCIALTSLAFIPLGALPRAMLPAFSEKKTQDVMVLRASFLGILKYAGVLNFLFFVLMVWAGPAICHALFGPEYPPETVRGLLVLIALGSFFEGYRLLTEPLLQGTGNARVTGFVEVLRLAAFLALAVWLIPHWPGHGVAVAIPAVAALAWLLRFVWIHRLVVYIPWGSTVALGAVAAGISIAAFYEHRPLFWGLVAAGVLLEAVQMGREDVRILSRILKAIVGRE